jgi:hypothetical protein
MVVRHILAHELAQMRLTEQITQYIRELLVT